MLRSFLIVAASVLLAQPVRAQSTLERGAMSRAKGQQGSTIMVYEIADFQCPYCARFAKEVFPRIDSAYVKTGKVQWFFVNLPLPTHANAWLASEAALCAGAVSDRFWPMHDRLFAAQTEWASSKDAGTVFNRLAREAGVAVEPFAACVANDQVAALILQDVMYAMRAGMTGTPGFVINNEQSFVGMKTFEEWKDLLERALAKGK